MTGKTRVVMALMRRFQGYLWQKKASNFQSKLLETKSIAIVDEFNSHTVKDQRVLNDWKQFLDQEQAVQCDRKGVQGSNCTKFMPFFLTSNDKIKNIKKLFGDALMRRIYVVYYPYPV
jgi:hypothetical protein